MIQINITLHGASVGKKYDCTEVKRRICDRQ